MSGNTELPTNMNDCQSAAAAVLTSPDSYGGAVAWFTYPCVIVYGVPVWLMPNGKVRVGKPHAEAVTPEAGARLVAALRESPEYLR